MRRSAFLCCIGLFFCLIGCEKAPIKIGVFLPFKGHLARFGINARNAIQLAAEEVNAEGGINGRKIVLVLENTAGSEAETLAAAKRLVGSGVVGIIGPGVSRKVLQIRPVMEAFDGPFISPVASSEKYSGLKDNLFRIESTGSERATILADYITRHRSIQRVLIIRNIGKEPYLDEVMDSFARRLEEKNGVITDIIYLDLTKEWDWTTTLNSLERKPADAVFIMHSSISLVHLAQTLREHDKDIQILGTNHAFHDSLLLAGGRDVEGTIFAVSHDPATSYPPYVNFINRFQKRFGGTGKSFTAVYSYEAAQVLFYGLKKTKGKKEGLLETLQQPTTFKGVYSPFSLDEFGDAKRENFLMTVKHGTFVKLSVDQQEERSSQ